jgi:hypothetical protein
MRLTVGPLPPAVYWRRRALVLGVALAILFVVFQACNATGAPGEESSNGDASPDPDPSLLRPTVGESPSGEPGGSPVPSDAADDSTDETPASPPSGEECSDDDILLIAEASRTEVTAGEVVRFTMRIRNDSQRTCHRDVGGDHRELYLSAGGETIWTSRACDPPTGTDVRALAPDDERAHHIDWNGRKRTSCVEGAMAEPGEYELRARLGTDLSEPVTVVVR